MILSGIRDIMVGVMEDFMEVVLGDITDMVSEVFMDTVAMDVVSEVIMDMMVMDMVTGMDMIMVMFMEEMVETITPLVPLIHPMAYIVEELNFLVERIGCKVSMKEILEIQISMKGAFQEGIMAIIIHQML